MQQMLHDALRVAVALSVLGALGFTAVALPWLLHRHYQMQANRWHAARLQREESPRSLAPVAPWTGPDVPLLPYQRRRVWLLALAGLVWFGYVVGRLRAF
jgi:hypothetical protein